MAYTEEETKELKEKYLTAEDKQAIVPVLAEEFDRPVKSIIGKLSREGVYEKKVYKTKTGKDPVQKKEIVHNIALLLDIDPEFIQGFVKPPKIELEYFYEELEKKLNGRNN